MAVSQMMAHYLQMKEKYKDCILFYRLGDFYEMFFDDAIKASKLLELTLTGKDCGLEERAPMCGVPYHAANTYIARLVEAGEKIAVCEQLVDPSLLKNGELVPRDVIKIISAGTVTEDYLLDEKKNNYICCAFKNGDTVALAWADITTGEFCCTDFLGKESMSNAVNQLIKLSVAEIISNDEMLMVSKDLNEVRHKLLPPFSNYTEWSFNLKHAESNLLSQFGVLSLAPYGISSKDSCICAAGALLEYLKDTQKHSLSNINSIKYIRSENYMLLDANAIRNLELVRSNSENKKYGTLLWVLDKTKTGMGARLLYNMVLSPLNSKEDIDYRLDGVEELYNSSVMRLGITDMLKSVKDIERLSGKISNGNLMPRDCIALASSLAAMPSLKLQLSGFSSKIINDINEGLTELTDVRELLTEAIDENPPALMKDGGYIKSGYNKELDELRNIRINSKNILADMEARERERTGIPKLKIGFNRVFGYYIEISKSYVSSAPDNYIRRQTLTSGERFVTPELKELEGKILNSEEASLKIEADIYQNIKNVLLKNIAALQSISRSVALLDCITAFACVAKDNKYVRPEIVSSSEQLVISDGRHPVIEAISKNRFIPNDVLLDSGDNRTMIITGPNMAGKSTYMRQVALITLMAHIGSFVPAKSAVIPIVDRIYTRVGASDNLIFDQSTFMVEMTEVADILLNATKNSLVILDEVGRGTSTYDGLSIAWAVVEYLTENVQAKTMFATHYHELTELEGKFDGVKNYRITVKELSGTIVFLRKIVRGGANRSFGIEVASLAGVPKAVTDRAKDILSSLEKSDITNKKKLSVNRKEEIVREKSEVERILNDIDVNSLSPIQALMLLSDLKEKSSK